MGRVCQNRWLLEGGLWFLGIFNKYRGVLVNAVTSFKNFKKISTQHLTVLTINVILQLEQIKSSNTTKENPFLLWHKGTKNYK